ncbi:unnamed protein product [Moneuplotes crassus]|uniref:Uncharacterized protein n=1 Tax=Euplotes crassus TaxID=5936 RepID=A0AAD1Y161_EUPCR|nr:unnamed protein product [Moneuplotes crassus]
MDNYRYQKSNGLEHKEVTTLFMTLRYANLAIVVGLIGLILHEWDDESIRTLFAPAVFFLMIPSIIFQIYPDIRFSSIFKTIVSTILALTAGFAILLFVIFMQTGDFIGNLLAGFAMIIIFFPTMLLNGTLLLALSTGSESSEVKCIITPQEHLKIQPLMI